MDIGVDPVAVEIGSLSVRWYSIMVALSVAFLVLWVRHFVMRVGIESERVFTAAIIAIPLAVIVARLVHVIDKLDYYSSNPGEIIGGDGLAVYGAILGGLLGSWIYCRLRGLDFAPLADLGAPGIILAQAIGRVGCILNGCCYGKETSLPWGFTYTHPDSEAPYGISVHPTHLYELLGDLVIFALLFWVLRGRLKPSGSILAMYLALYSALTFTVRFWRGDTEPFAGPIHEGQLISIVLFVLAVGWMVLNKVHWVGKLPEDRSGGVEGPSVIQSAD